MNSANKKTKILKTVLSVIWWLAVIALVALMLNIIGAKIKGKVPNVFGYSILNIVTGSMEDEIPTGSYILVKKTKPENIKKGDVICFYSDDPQIYGMPNTHRVVEDPIVTENGIEFVTRGDANAANDTVTAKGERLVGVYVKRLNGLKDFARGLEGGGMIAIIVILQIGIFGVFAVSVILKSKSEK